MAGWLSRGASRGGVVSLSKHPAGGKGVNGVAVVDATRGGILGSASCGVSSSGARSDRAAGQRVGNPESAAASPSRNAPHEREFKGESTWKNGSCRKRGEESRGEEGEGGEVQYVWYGQSSRLGWSRPPGWCSRVCGAGALAVGGWNHVHSDLSTAAASDLLSPK